MDRRMRGVALLLVLAVLAAGCGWLRGDEAPEPVGGVQGGADTGDSPAISGVASGAAAAPAPEGPTTVAVADTALGPILVDGRGWTLYRFLPDGRQVQACSGDCLTQWPLLPWNGQVQAGAGLDPAALQPVERAEGVQVTCGGWPLYTFTGDTAPGETNGHQLNGSWYAVAPDCQMLSQTTGGGSQ